MKHLLGLLVLIFPLITLATEKNDSATLKNRWIDITITSANAGQIKQASFMEHEFFWPRRTEITTSDFQLERFYTGSNLLLLTEHPKTSFAHIKMPTDCDLEPLSDNTIRVSGTTDNVLITREFSIEPNQSTMRVLTTLKNTGNEPLILYPSENIYFNSEINQNRSANLMSYFYSPYESEKDQQSEGINRNSPPHYDITLGLANNTQFGELPLHDIFFIDYSGRIGGISLTNHKNWLAFHTTRSNQSTVVINERYKAGPCASVTFDYLTENFIPISDNLNIFISGIGEYIHNNQLNKSPVNCEKFVRALHTHGKINLNPQDEWFYSSIWSFTSTVAPVINIKDGIQFQQDLVVRNMPDGYQGFFFKAGIPNKGTIYIQYFDDPKTEVPFKSTKIPLTLLDPKLRRPEEVSPEWATIVSHRFSIFSPVEFRDVEDSLDKLVDDKIKKIRIVVLDDYKSVIQVIAEAKAPFLRAQ